MNVLRFEWKKLIKNKLFFLFCGIGLLFPVILFYSNHLQLPKALETYTNEIANLSFKALSNDQGLQMLIEEFPDERENEKRQQIKSANLLVKNHIRDAEESIRARDGKSNQKLISMYQEIQNFEEIIQGDLNYSYQFEAQDLANRIGFYQYLEENQFSFENSKLTINFANFVHRVGGILFNRAGVIILLILLNLPTILEFMEGTNKQLILEYKQNKKNSVMQYFLFQALLLGVLLICVFGSSLIVSKFFGEGLVFDTINHFNYPISFTVNHMVTIGDRFVQWFLIGIPLIVLLNQLFKYSLFKFENPILAIGGFAVVVFLVISASTQFSTSWNPFSYLETILSVSIVKELILSGCLLLANGVLLVIMNKQFKKVRLR